MQSRTAFKIQYLDFALATFMVLMYSIPKVTAIQASMLCMLVFASLVAVFRNGIHVRRLITRKYLVWYTVIMLYIMASKFWQVYPYDSPFFATESRLYPALICLILYLTSAERVEKFLGFFVTACTAMAISALCTSPFSTWGTTSFTGLTGIHRNSIGYYMLFAAYLSFLLYQNSKRKKIYLACCLICLITGVITGSRKVIVAIVIIVAMHLIFSRNMSSAIKKGLIIGVVGLIVVWALSRASWFNAFYGERLSALFNGNEINDNSIIGRHILTQNSMELFFQHPLIGAGLDNDRAINAMRYFEAPAHNNYAYLLGDFGLIGFIFYYIPFVYVLIRSFKLWLHDRDNWWIKYVLISGILIFILDFSGGYCFTIRGDYLYVMLFAMYLVYDRTAHEH